MTSKKTPGIGPTVHLDDCREPKFKWQTIICEGLPRIGVCVHCGATRVDRAGAPARFQGMNS